MTQDMNLLQLTVEQRAQAMAVFDECADLREFGCRMLEAVMNAVMDADAQDTCGAARGERSEARENSRNGYRPRTLRTAAGDLELAIPKLRRGTYYPEGILGRYTRVEASMVALVREVFCGCSWQRCVTHLQRDLQGRVRTRAGKAACAELVRLATTQADAALARAVWDEAQPYVAALSRAAGWAFGEAREDALAYMAFPREHWPKIRTNNQQERANREIKRRYRSVQSFPSRASMMRLTCAVLMGEEGRWQAQRLLSPSSLAKAALSAAEPPSDERLEAARLYAAEAVREVVDRRGLRK